MGSFRSNDRPFMGDSCRIPDREGPTPAAANWSWRRLNPTGWSDGGLGDDAVVWPSVDLAMDQYLYIPFLVGWTSIYQLFWCELQGYQGFDTLPFDWWLEFWSCGPWRSPRAPHIKPGGARKALLWTLWQGAIDGTWWVNMAGDDAFWSPSQDAVDSNHDSGPGVCWGGLDLIIIPPSAAASESPSSPSESQQGRRSQCDFFSLCPEAFHTSDSTVWFFLLGWTPTACLICQHPSGCWSQFWVVPMNLLGVIFFEHRWTTAEKVTVINQDWTKPGHLLPIALPRMHTWWILHDFDMGISQDGRWIILLAFISSFHGPPAIFFGGC